LPLQLALGPGLIAIKGYAAPEVERAFTRARELCERLGDPAELFPALLGVWMVYYLRGELRVANALAEQLMQRAQSAHDPALLILAHTALGDTASSMGRPLISMKHLELAMSLYDPERHPGLTLAGRVGPLSYAGLNLWALGYPDQALKRSNEALGLAHGLTHPVDLAFAEFFVGSLLQFRRDARAAQEATERLIALSTEHGFTFWLALATIERTPPRPSPTPPG
jgi:predicted ATPase